ncbi:hypothetical protein ACFLS1_08675 [Verrucomicrobiota bacterium]
MRILFLTQSSSLSVFSGVAERIGNIAPESSFAFYVADSLYYEKFISEHPAFEKKHSNCLYEWKILEKASGRSGDVSFLRKKEREFDNHTLWNSIIADRRLFLGARAVYCEDLKSRYKHEELLSIVDTAIRELESFISEFKPDIIVGFICVTVGEYITSLIAKRDGIKFVNLRPTRIGNYFYGAEDVHEPSEKLKEEYKSILADDSDEKLFEKVRDYLEFVRKEHGMYEGVIPAKNAPKVSLSDTSGKGFLSKMAAAARMIRCQYSGKYLYDNHCPGLFGLTWFRRVVMPIRIDSINKALANSYVTESELKTMDFVYYPLHKEPEITLLVYSNTYIDQIEVVRRIARNLPLGMNLLVKEHPACFGYRPLKYYRDLLTVPNVRLVSPDFEGRELIKRASITAIISGSSGFEALILKKPVIALGHVPFEFLPDSMIKKITNLEDLSKEILWLLDHHDHSEKAMEAYVAAVMNLSVPIDFYSRLLGRGNVYREPGGVSDDDKRGEHVDRLARYIKNMAC